jgi:glycosyltransferase involved in cell wall biosynthesis
MNGPEQRPLNLPLLSIIIPVHNGGADFQRCLTAIHGSSCNDWELIVVDDGSTDDSVASAAAAGATVLHTGGRLGPAAARNQGARAACGKILYFIDADCEVHPDTLAHIVQLFAARPELDAMFGAYDDQPAAPNFIAQYKNLFHHYIHQLSNPQASTFWTGCGAIKRSQFLALNGFDTGRYRRPSIEDIDLGHRLTQQGGRIELAKHIQVKHLKAWTLLSLIRSDIFDRGIPWSRLILKDKAFASDLNLQTHNRISVIAIYGAILAGLAAFFQPLSLFLILGLALLLLWLNAPLYHFFYQKRGLLFALRVIPLHWLYYLYNGFSFGCGLLLHGRDQWCAANRVSPAPPMPGRGESDGNG